MDLTKTVLILIDIQNDYFPGGKYELMESEKASLNAKELLEEFRRKSLPIIHVRHESLRPEGSFFLPNTTGAGIHSKVAPRDGETVILKHRPSSFMGTNFETELRDRGIEHLVIVGMQTDCCVRATSLDALKFGFEVTIIEDAVAARGVEAHQAALKEMRENQARVIKTKDLINSINDK